VRTVHEDGITFKKKKARDGMDPYDKVLNRTVIVVGVHKFQNQNRREDTLDFRSAKEY